MKYTLTVTKCRIKSVTVTTIQDSTWIAQREKCRVHLNIWSMKDTMCPTKNVTSNINDLDHIHLELFHWLYKVNIIVWTNDNNVVFVMVRSYWDMWLSHRHQRTILLLTKTEPTSTAPTTAIASISTLPFFGRAATWKAALAGSWSLKNWL